MSSAPFGGRVVIDCDLQDVYRLNNLYKAISSAPFGGRVEIVCVFTQLDIR